MFGVYGLPLSRLVSSVRVGRGRALISCVTIYEVFGGGI